LNASQQAVIGQGGEQETFARPFWSRLWSPFPARPCQKKACGTSLLGVQCARFTSKKNF